MKKNFYLRKFILLILLSFFAIGISKAQNADFTISKDSVELGSAAVFSNTSTGFDSTVYYVWTFYNVKINQTHPATFDYVLDTTLHLNDSLVMYYPYAANYKIKMQAYDSGSVWLDSISKICIVSNEGFDDCLSGTFNVCDYLCNGSFENLNSMANINQPGLLNKANRWASPKIPTGFYNVGATPDLFSRFASNPVVSVPTNSPSSYQNPSPATGNNYAGLVCYEEQNNVPNEYREYAQTALLQSLVPSQKYYIGMKVSLAENSTYMVDTIGINLSLIQPGQYYSSNHSFSNLFYQVGNPGNQFTLQPQIKGKVLPILNKWQLISDTIIGNGENYLTIGNFKDDAHSNSVNITSSNINGENLAYYFIDSVFVVPVHSPSNLTYYACADSIVHLVSTVQLNDVLYFWSNTTGDGYNYTDINLTGDTTIYCTATYVGSNGFCDIIDTFNIVLAPDPIVTVNNSVIDCEACDTLTVSGINAATYVWSTGETTQSIIVCPLQSSQYIVSVYNSLHCEPPVVLTATVTIPPAPPAPELKYFVNNTCGSGPYTYPYEIANPVSGTTYHWMLDSPLGTPGYFNGTPGLTFVDATNVTITWDTNYIPALPGYAKIIIEADDMHKCTTTSEFRIFRCCDPWGEETGPVYLNNTNATTALDSNYVWDRNILINGNFFVNTNLNVVSSIFFMGPEAAIIVDSGYNFDVSGTPIQSEFHSGCDFMWKGIVVKDSASILSLKNTKINDAYVSVDASNKARIQLEDNTFTNNDIGLRMSEYVNPVNSIAEIYGNTFTSSLISSNISFYPPLNVPYKKPYSGIVVEHSNNITIGQENQAPNIFSMMYHGIKSKNSAINVYNNDFSDIKDCFGGNPVAGFMEPFGVAIYSVRALAFVPSGFTGQGILIGGNIQKANNFVDCKYGFYSSNDKKFQVYANSFDSCRVSIYAGQICAQKLPGSKIIYSNTIDHVKYCGIQLQGIEKAVVQYNAINNIDMPPSGNTLYRTYGILARGCLGSTIYGNRLLNADPTTELRNEGICTQGGTYFIACNDITNTGKGMAFYGSHIPSTVQNNDMEGNRYGIYLNHGAIGDQGSATKPSDNRWIGNTFEGHTFAENWAFGSFIYVRDYNSTWWTEEFHPTIMINDWLNPSQPFSDQNSSGRGNFCKTPQQTAIAFSLNKEMGEQIYNNQLAFAEFQDNNVWMSNFYLYDYLRTAEPDSMDQWMKDYLGQYDENNSNITLISDYLAENQFSKAKDLIGKTTAQSPPAQIILDIFDIVSDAALGRNNATDDILYYNYQLAALRVIAAYCPYEYGNGVYLARSILSNIEPAIYHNECEDIIEQRKMEKPKDNNNSITQVKVYPNPASDAFTIEFTGDVMGKKTRVELYNLYGKLVKIVTESASSKLSVNTQDLSAGIYFYRVSLDNTLLSKDKIIIIR